ncbi:MAG: glycosyl hydrolase [Pelobium sp.]
MIKNYQRKALLTFLLSGFLTISFAQSQLTWPKITQQNKPWTRWWWEGSAVDTANLNWIMNKYQKAGLGGLEITTIYGVKGQESKFIDFLTPKWMDMLSYTLDKAKSLDLGIDMAQASGWPFGGPWVKDEDASKYMAYKIYRLKGDEKIIEPLLYEQKPLLRQEGGMRSNITTLVQPISKNANLQTLAIDQVQFAQTLKPVILMAYSQDGRVIDITDQLNEDATLNWTAPAKEGLWTLYAVYSGLHGKMVERAGPGGEGYAIDHFSKKATDDYLNHFDEAFKGYDLSYMRGFFNDSYEVDDARGEADWTPGFFEEFKKRKGYDLQNELPALLGNSPDAAHNARVLTDYRETISDLLLENYTKEWHKWAKGKGKIIRNQAHGSPANILDLYAATDIPEAEGDNVLRIKFASSAAHVTGKPLASSESATWENDHFLSKLGDVKKKMDLFLLGGINHTFYHGSNYTPKDAPWPGWLFYAAVHFTPNNSFYNDFPTLNKYVAHAQSFLQDGKPNNDFLMYLPISDAYAKRGNSMLIHFDGMEKGFKGTNLEAAAHQLYDKGYDFDFISDQQILQTTALNNQIKTADVSYKTLLVPGADLIPLETMKHLFDLASSGVNIIFYKSLPTDVPGFADLATRQTALKAMMAKLIFQKVGDVQTAKLGKGSISLSNDLDALMKAANIAPESMKTKGLNFIRRANEKGKYYFIVNENDAPIDGWFTINTKAQSVSLFNPMTEEKGYAAIKQTANGTEVYLQLKKGESCILQTLTNESHTADYAYYKVKSASTPITGEWRLKFVSGGPELPKAVEMESLKSWTDFGTEYQRFSGTASYSTKFKRPKGKAIAYLLDLGRVEETVKIILNGEELETEIGPDFKVKIPAIKLKRKNTLELLVSNGMANRAAWMDKTNQNYKIFYNINFSAHNAENRGPDGLFTAKNWEVKSSGLMGPVSLTPLAVFKPE